VPHGIGALGYTLQRPSEDRHLLRRAELLDKLVVLLGGRAAEMLVFDEPSTGAADDLVKATDLARDMVLRYGMDGGLGPIAYGERPSPFLEPSARPGTMLGSYGASEQTARQIDNAVHGLLKGALERAVQLLRVRRAALDRCVQALMAKETLDESELLALLDTESEVPAALAAIASPDSARQAAADVH
jgi:cell division protease FtsH